MRVIRGSFAILNMIEFPAEESASLASMRDSLSSSASTRMVRNLNMVKVLPSSPTRSWVKKAGPPSFRRTMRATMIHSGVSRIMPKRAAKMSHMRLMALSAEAARSDACSNARAVDAARAVGFVKVVICASSFYFLKLKCCMSVRAEKTAPNWDIY